MWSLSSRSWTPGSPSRSRNVVGVPVARQELLDALRGLAEIRPDDHDVAETLGDQLDPPKEEGPHENVGELAVGLEEVDEVGPLHLDHLSRLGDHEVHERLPSRQHVGLAGELAGFLNGHDLLGLRGSPNDLDRTLRDQEEGFRRLSRRLQHLAAAHRADAPARRDPLDLLRRQRGKDLIRARRIGQRNDASGLGHLHTLVSRPRAIRYPIPTTARRPDERAQASAGALSRHPLPSARRPSAREAALATRRPARISRRSR